VDPDPQTMMPTDNLAGASKQWLVKLLGKEFASKLQTVQDVINSDKASFISKLTVLIFVYSTQKCWRHWLQE